MGLLSALGRNARGIGKYLGVTGGIGGALGAGFGALSEPDDRLAGARDGALTGAAIGPVTVPAMASALAGLIPVAGTGALAHMLYSGSPGQNRTRARVSLSEVDAFAQMVREQQEEEFRRIMAARFGDGAE
jgi:hypothetical protein